MNPEMLKFGQWFIYPHPDLGEYSEIGEWHGNPERCMVTKVEKWANGNGYEITLAFEIDGRIMSDANIKSLEPFIPEISFNWEQESFADRFSARIMGNDFVYDVINIKGKNGQQKTAYKLYENWLTKEITRTNLHSIEKVITKRLVDEYSNIWKV